MIKMLQFVIRLFPAVAVAIAVAPAVHAGCGDTSTLQTPFVFAQTGVDTQSLMQKAADATRTATLRAASGGAAFNTATIVGMWNIQFISKGNTNHNPQIPDGALIDFGYTQWHSDGTELMNSGGHTPITGNWCMGTWVRSGYFTYELNHWALSYDATSQALAVKINILEQVTLDPSGNEFTGTFTITVFDAKSGTQVDKLTGTLAATRVTVDQTTP